MIQKEESLDRKLENAEKKEQSIASKQRDLQKKNEDLEQLRKKQIENLERISGLTREEAKGMLIESIERRRTP